LQVFLARCGAASRRECEKLISAGRVAVNGRIVREPGTKAGAGDTVTLDGKAVRPEETLRYIALNKPPFYICSSRDSQNRPLAGDLLPETIKERLYNVGRLDYRSSGLIFFTNDGNFAARLSHPSFEIEKEYIATVSKKVPQALLEEFLRGITIKNVRYQCKKIEILNGRSRKEGRGREEERGLPGGAGRTLKIILNEGKNREIRNVFSFFHIHLTELTRTRIGSVSLGNLPPGKTRPLTRDEVNSFLCLKKQPPSEAPL